MKKELSDWNQLANAQLRARQPDYDPRKGRSDEFALEQPEQPALNLTPEKAEAYLHALDRSGLGFRLPTVAEWTLAANAGRATHYWWGDMAAFPDGANLLGPEPGLTADTTATRSGFKPNPWGLFHTYGNVEEWAKEADGSFHRLGGHFRTEPSETPPALKVAGPREIGPDPYVGVRVALDLTPEIGATILRKQLATVPGLRSPQASFDPDRGLATITGECDDTAIRRAADQVVGRLWFVAAIDNQIVAPTPPPRGLAMIGKVAGPPRKTRPLGRQIDLIPMEVRWANPLPVAGSDWFANMYLSGGRHFSHRLFDGEPGPSRRVTLSLDLANLANSEPIQVALSLGKSAPRPGDPNIVSNLATIVWPPSPKMATARP